MSVSKFCTKGNDRCATFMWHAEAGEVEVGRARNHYEQECSIKQGNVLAPVQVGGSSGSASELA